MPNIEPKFFLICHLLPSKRGIIWVPVLGLSKGKPNKLCQNNIKVINNNNGFPLTNPKPFFLGIFPDFQPQPIFAKEFSQPEPDREGLYISQFSYHLLLGSLFFLIGSSISQALVSFSIIFILIGHILGVNILRKIYRRASFA